MNTLEETAALMARLSEADQRRVKEFAQQLLGKQYEVLPGRTYRRITMQEAYRDDAIDTMYAELRIG